MRAMATKRGGRCAGAWVITGGASGFGREFARRLAARGEQLVLWDLDRSALARAAAELGVGVYTDVVDVRDPEALVEAAKRARAAVGPLGHVANCAGVLRVGSLGGLDASAGELMWKLHVGAATQLADRLLPAMSAAGAGRMVLVGSRVSGGIAGRSQDAASKAALVSLARRYGLPVRPPG